MSIISIEGNIGAGKSTLLSLLDVEIMKEPVDEWQNVGGVSILERYYNYPKRWAFTFQLNALHSRSQIWEQSINKDREKIYFSERSPLADRYIFGQMMNQSGNIQPFQYLVYDSICSEIMSKLPLMGIIYLKCDPDICLSRIKGRGRKGEDSITLDYLEKVHDCHENWLGKQSKIPTLTIDTSLCNIYNPENQLHIEQKVMEFTNNLQFSRNI